MKLDIETIKENVNKLLETPSQIDDRTIFFQLFNALQTTNNLAEMKEKGLNILDIENEFLEAATDLIQYYYSMEELDDFNDGERPNQDNLFHQFFIQKDIIKEIENLTPIPNFNTDYI